MCVCVFCDTLCLFVYLYLNDQREGDLEMGIFIHLLFTCLLYILCLQTECVFYALCILELIPLWKIIIIDKTGQSNE